MAGIRGVRNPVPKRGSAPTGIFSTKGSQKKDKNTFAHQNMTGSNYRGPKTDPVKRDNRIKGQ